MCCDLVEPPIAVLTGSPLKKLFIFIGPPTHSRSGSNKFSATSFMHLI